MALIKCHECGNKVSTEAAACPSCGAGVQLPATKPPGKGGLTFGAKIGLGLLLMAFIISAVNSCNRDNDVEKEKARVAALTPEQRAAEQKVVAEKAKAEAAAKEKAAVEEKKDTARFVVATKVAEALKRSMRDPDSFKIDSLRVNDDANVACVVFRARNGFGGMNRDMAVYANDRMSQEQKAWNKNCTGKMYDLKYAVD